MPILTVPDLATYAPGIPAADRTPVMIVLAESLAFGPNGSGRRLDRQEITEVRRLASTWEVVPSHPIVSSLPVKVEWRESKVDNTWYDVAAASVEVSKNRVRVDSRAPIVSAQSGHYGRRPGYMQSRRPKFGNAFPELRLTYTTGIDFTVSTDESEMIKAALGGIMTLQYAASRGLNQMTTSVNAIASGSSVGRVLLEKSVDGEASLRYDSPNNAAQGSRSLLAEGSASGQAGGLMADYLSIFKAYKFTLPTA
jgi:hypothetical protein